MKKKIYQSVLQYVKELEKYGHSVSPFFREESIHDFRTTTKKLRALLRWQKVHNDILPGSFIKIYHASGDLRNAQLLLISLNEKNTNLPAFLLWLATYIGNRETDWKNRYHKKTMRKLRQKMSKVILEKQDNTKLQLYFSKKIQKLQTMIALPAPTDDRLHSVRKILKDLLYIRQWCKANWVEGIRVSKKVSLLRLKKLGEQAGYFNDKRTELLLLAAYLEEETNDKAIESAKSVQKILEQRKAILKKQLLKSLHQFCIQVQPSNSSSDNVK